MKQMEAVDYVETTVEWEQWVSSFWFRPRIWFDL